MSYISSWDSEYVYFNWNAEISSLPKYYTFNKDEYELIIQDDKYVLKPKEEEIMLPDTIPDHLFKL